MRALVYAGAKKAELREVAEPEPKAGSVKIAVKYCGVCGSDIGIFLGTHPRAKAPLIFGHEFLGTVEEDGKKFRKGDRVVAYPLLSCGHCRACRAGNRHVCNTLGLIGIDEDGGMCESMYVNEDVMFRVPDGVSDRAAVTVEPLAVIVHSLHQVGFQARETAVVVGAGPIGILTGIALKYCGAEKVFISDIFEKRLILAEELGLTPVNPSKENLQDIVMAATDGEGCDVLFECSGSESAALEMTEITRVSGRICMTSVHKAPHKVNLQRINFKEQMIIGTRCYSMDEFGQALRLTADMQPQLEKVVSHIVPLSEASKVFDMIADPDCGTCKVVVDCTK
ncbi:MAG: alcohol dehydrogenase catalytic domain-containing protein [Lachnospiraceae bacterium]|nr:alcohol dehydrogenase catalytic domain-containing protein [Lachnospiraceae bacterium]